MNRSPIDFLWETPPYCPTPACSMHGVPAQEHHVEGCPLYDTLASQMHHLSHAFRDVGEAMAPAADAIVAILALSWRGRLALLKWRLRRVLPI